MAIVRKSSRSRREFVDAAKLDSRPEHARPVQVNRQNVVVAQAVRITGFVLIRGESPGLSIVTIEPAIRSHPKTPRSIFGDRQHAVIASAQAVCVFWVVQVVTELLCLRVEIESCSDYLYAKAA